MAQRVDVGKELATARLLSSGGSLMPNRSTARHLGAPFLGRALRCWPKPKVWRSRLSSFSDELRPVT
eukprot:12911142-Prorocentrum_lima.AAC.1